MQPEKDVTIIPGIIKKFSEIYHKVDTVSPPLKRPLKTFQKIFQYAQPDAELSEIMNTSKEELLVDVLRKDDYVFVISKATHTLVEIFWRKELPSEVEAVLVEKRRVVEEHRVQEKEKLVKQRRRENTILGWRWYTPLHGTPPLDMEKVRFSTHALRRVQQRFPAHAGENPEVMARIFFSHTREEKSFGVGTVRRLISNNFEKARYFTFGKCRFVVKEMPDGTFLVLTIEIDWFRK